VVLLKYLPDFFLNRPIVTKHFLHVFRLNALCLSPRFPRLGDERWISRVENPPFKTEIAGPEFIGMRFSHCQPTCSEANIAADI